MTAFTFNSWWGHQTASVSADHAYETPQVALLWTISTVHQVLICHAREYHWPFNVPQVSHSLKTTDVRFAGLPSICFHDIKFS
jgi:hypothetical protein